MIDGRKRLALTAYSSIYRILASIYCNCLQGMLISAQIRAARALLGWSARELAAHAGVHISTVQRIERRQGPLRASADSLRRIEHALEEAGVAFQTTEECPGVCLRRTTADHSG